MYYQIFTQHAAVIPRVSFDPNDPYIGRIDVRALALPRTISILKRYVADMEHLLITDIIALRINEDDEAAADDNARILRDVGSPGTSPESPLAIIIKHSNFPQSLEIATAKDLPSSELHEILIKSILTLPFSFDRSIGANAIFFVYLNLSVQSP